MVGYQAKPDSTWHFVTGHRCYSGRSHVPPFPTLWSHVFTVSFSMSFISYMSFPRVSIIVILDSGFAYIQVWKAKFACDWAYHAPTTKYVSYEGFFLSSRILFSALWRWKGDHVVDPLGKSWQHTSASTGGSEPAFNSFMLFSKIFYIHEALVEPSLNSRWLFMQNRWKMGVLPFSPEVCSRMKVSEQHLGGYEVLSFTNCIHITRRKPT